MSVSVDVFIVCIYTCVVNVSVDVFIVSVFMSVL